MGNGLIAQLLSRETPNIRAGRPVGRSPLAPKRAGEELRHNLVEQ